MSKNIPVRMPDDLYEQIVASKPEDLPLSTWLLKLIRRGLDVGVDSTYTNVDNILLTSHESRIVELEKHLEVEASILSRLDAIEEWIGATTPNKTEPVVSFEPPQDEPNNEVVEVTTPQAARMLGCSPSTLSKAFSENRVPYRNNGLTATPTNKTVGKSTVWKISRQ